MKLGIVGPGECGKDSAANWLAANTPLRYTQSTSWYYRHAVFAAMPLVDRMFYVTADEAWSDRRDRRQFWFDTIAEINRRDCVTAYSLCLADQDILVGVRSAAEFLQLREARIVDEWWYIKRPGCVDETCQIRAEDCDRVIRNDGTLAEFYELVSDAYKLATVAQQSLEVCRPAP